MAGHGLDVLPLALAAGRPALDLQAAQPVEEDGDGAEVRVRRQANRVRVGRVRELARQPTVVAGRLRERVEVHERVGWQVQLLLQRPQYLHAALVRVFGERFEKVAVLHDRGWVGPCRRDVVHVVFGDVEKFGRVGSKVFVSVLDGSSCFVTEH